MIPLGRSIPNVPTNTAGTPDSATGGQIPSDFNPTRRRSSIDAIMGHLRYVGSFPGRVMHDLSQPNLNVQQRPPGFLGGMQSQTSFGSSTSSFGTSSTNLGAAFGQPQQTQKEPVQQTAPLPKVPAAEAFLSI